MNVSQVSEWVSELTDSLQSGILIPFLTSFHMICFVLSIPPFPPFFFLNSLF
jgi:hypothetical protein